MSEVADCTLPANPAQLFSIESFSGVGAASSARVTSGMCGGGAESPVAQMVCRNLACGLGPYHARSEHDPRREASGNRIGYEYPDSRITEPASRFRLGVPASAPAAGNAAGARAWRTSPGDAAGSLHPTDALEVFLRVRGSAALLLYLITATELDILDIPVAEITRQYVDYIDLMQEMRLELAAEYLVMAAILAEIKSRLLLPRPPDAEGIEADPRAELVRRLQEYERFKKAAADIDELPRMERDTAAAAAHVPDRNIIRLPPPVDLRELLLSLKDVLNRAELFSHHAIQREALSVRNRMSDVLRALDNGEFHPFESLFDLSEGRHGIIVTFLAILELAKEQLVEISQRETLAPIYLKSLALSD